MIITFLLSLLVLNYSIYGQPISEADYCLVKENHIIEGTSIKKASAVDILFVIDNSQSMERNQEHLSKNISRITSSLINLDSDFNIAITTTDFQIITNGLGRDRLNSTLARERPKKFLNKMEKLTLVGTDGNGREKSFDSAMEFFHLNGGDFVNNHSKLLIIFLTDTDEPEPSKLESDKFITELKRYKSLEDVIVFSFIGDETKGKKFIDLNQTLRGDYFLLKKEQELNEFNRFVQDMMIQIEEDLDREYSFELKQTPITAKGFIVKSINKKGVLVRSDSISYDQQKIKFVAEAIKRDQEIQIHYWVACHKETKEDIDLRINIDEVDSLASTLAYLINQDLKLLTSELKSIPKKCEDCSEKKIIKKLSQEYDVVKKREKELRLEYLEKIQQRQTILKRIEQIEVKLLSLENEEQKNSENHEQLKMIRKLNEQLIKEDKDILYIIDVSGSMGGDPLKQVASEIIHQASLLHQSQQINIAIDTGSELKLLFKEKVSVKDLSLNKINSFIRRNFNSFSTVNRGIQYVHKSGHYDEVVILSDSYLFDEKEFIPLSEKVKFPIHSVIINSDFYQPNYREFNYIIKQELQTCELALEMQKNEKSYQTEIIARQKLYRQNNLDESLDGQLTAMVYAEKYTADVLNEMISDLKVRLSIFDFNPQNAQYSLEIASINSGGKTTFVPSWDVHFSSYPTGRLNAVNKRDKEISELQQERNELIRQLTKENTAKEK